MIRLARELHPDFQFLVGDAHHAAELIHSEKLPRHFDVIILSDLVNDLWDLREVFDALRPLCSADTRIILNFHSQLYEKPFGLSSRLKWSTPRLRQNWFTPDDVKNIANLANYSLVHRFDGYLFPFQIPVITPLFNRYLAKLPGFRAFNLTHFMILRPYFTAPQNPAKVSVIIPARNEAENIENAILRTPELGGGTEIIFVEGNSSDASWQVIQEMKNKYASRDIKIFQQSGKGKGDAVRKGFAHATGEILMILDADLTVPPEALPQFYDAISSGKAEFVNGVRLVYPREQEAMRFTNLIANKFFSIAFSWLIDRPLKDTLCGTKVISRKNYERLIANRHYFGDFDPFGDFDLLFGAAKLNLEIRDLPIRYRDRVYGETQINRWRDGWYLLRMVIFAARKIKFI